MPNEQKVTRKLRAILSADVKGYSILMSDDEVFTIRTLKEYRNIMSNCIQQHSGRVVDNPGDNLLAEFSSALDAVECAVEVQKKLKKENARFVEDKRLQFRIGVNIGDVVQDGDRIYGSGVNVAARIEGLADPGGICVSRNTYDHVKDKLDLGFDYLGEHEVKNIKEPVRVYKVLKGTDVPKSLVEEKLDLPDKPSIAVLPFTNMSGDPSQEYFSDGLTEQIINGLCKVSNLFVIARNSSFAYKGKTVNVKQIAKELGVRYILEGSVQRAGDRVRITAQLIDATTDYHMWSENYDRDLEDIFAFQDAITLKIMEMMHIKLTMGEQARIWAGATTNIQAFDLMMRGNHYSLNFNKKDNIQARKYYKEALSIDNTSAVIYVALGLSHFNDLFHTWSKSPIESFEQAEINVNKALSLNDSLDVSHSLLGLIYLMKRKHDEAIKEGEKAIDLNPNGAIALFHFALILTFSDKVDLSIKSIERAFRLDPVPPVYYFRLKAFNYLLIGEYEKAIDYGEKCLEMVPDQAFPYLTLVASFSALNRIDESRKAVEEVLRIHPEISLNNLVMMAPMKNQQELNRITSLARKAGLPD